jgi:hypothetical protein
MVGGTPPVGNQSVEVVIKDFLFIPLLTGDYNGDGVVDASDYNAWRSSFGTQVTRFSGADGDGDGVIGANDYIVWRANLGRTISSAGQASLAVPEPAFLTLLACAVFQLAVFSRRRTEADLLSADLRRKYCDSTAVEAISIAICFRRSCLAYKRVYVAEAVRE